MSITATSPNYDNPVDLISLVRAVCEECERVGYHESGVEAIRIQVANLLTQERRQTILDCDRRGTAGTWPLPAMEGVERERMARVDREKLQAELAHSKSVADAAARNAMGDIHGLNQRVAILEALLDQKISQAAALAAQETGRPDTLQLIAQSYERMRHDGRQFAAEQAEAAAKIADLTKCLAECEGALECCGHPIEQAEAPAGFALVPLKPNAEMECLFAEGEWEWRDVLAAAEAITEEQHAGISEQAEALKDAADMFWDHDDGERFGTDIEEIVADYDPGEIVKIDQAKRLPSITVRTILDGEYMTYEVLDDAAIASAEGAQS